MGSFRELEVAAYAIKFNEILGSRILELLIFDGFLKQSYKIAKWWNFDISPKVEIAP